jgi:hypothetical protein
VAFDLAPDDRFHKATGMKALALAVIQQAVEDFEKRGKPLVYAVPDDNRDAAVARAEAVDFLTSDAVEWKESREMWAKVAGVSARKMRAWARRQMEV